MPKPKSTFIVEFQKSNFVKNEFVVQFQTKVKGFLLVQNKTNQFVLLSLKVFTIGRLSRDMDCKFPNS